MKVLLTGDKGYIGTVMKKHLRNGGHDVVGLDSNYFASCTLGGFDWYEADEQHISKDIRDISVDELRGYDAIIHLAGLSNDLMGDFNRNLTLEVNLYATLMLASKAKRAGVTRFIFASSCSVYGASDDIVDETTTLNPITTYALSKVEAERGINLVSFYKMEAEEEIRGLADDTFSPTFMRNATVFGYSFRHRNDLIVNTMTSHAHTTGKITINGDGKLWRPLVSVIDVAKAFKLVLEADRNLIHNQIFNVGFDSENYTVLDVANLVADALGATIGFTPSADTRNYRVCFGKIAKAFPEFVTPLMTVKDGIHELVEIYKDCEALQATNLTKDYLLGERFVRILHLKHLLEIGSLDENLMWTR
jgi:nucleoside-diphosphate-sugar epimerase